MTDPGAPPPPGTDTPVPADVVPVRPVAKRSTPAPDSAPDHLVPVNAVEQRRRARAQARQAALLQRQRDAVLAPYFAPASPAYPAPPPLFIPKRPFTKPQQQAVWFGSLLSQLALSLGTHVFFAFLIVGGSIALTQLENPNNPGSPTRSFTAFMSFWTHPDRYLGGLALSLLIAIVIGGLGWAAAAIWQRRFGLRAPNKSIALAYVTSQGIALLLGWLYWVLVVAVWFMAIASGGSTPGSVGDLWATLLIPLAISVVFVALIGVLFNFTYLRGFRVRPTLADLERERIEAERRAEAHAAAVDATVFADEP